MTNPVEIQMEKGYRSTCHNHIPNTSALAERTRDSQKQVVGRKDTL